jgi:hypothetical protein
MKKKLINLLKTSYSDKGFNATELEGIADLLITSNNLKDESTDEELSNAVSGASSYVNLLQKVGNRYASQVESKYQGYVKPEPPEPPKKPIEEPATLTKEQVAEMLRTGIEDALKPYKEAETQKRLDSVLRSQDKLKSIPEKFVSRYKLDKEENAETLATQIEQEYAEERKAILESMGIADIPNIGIGGTGSEDDFAAKMKEAQQALAPKE